MGVLSGPEIVRVVALTTRLKQQYQGMDWPPSVIPHPLIEITPFDPDRAGPNSYDVTLADKLLVYAIGGKSSLYWDASGKWCSGPVLDTKQINYTMQKDIPPDGLVLVPGVLYLGSTVERTMTSGLVPWLDGRSSIGRLGCQIHATAGRGDDGFGEQVDGGCAWTLEITVTHPLRIYSGERIGQLTFLTLDGKRNPYRGRYGKQTEPTASRLWQDKSDASADNT